MKWGYIREKYLQIIEKICCYMFDVVISVDVIVGFLGEMEVQFENIFNLIEEVGFDLFNIVVYFFCFGIFVVFWDN